MLVAFLQVDVLPLLLDEHAGRCNVAVNKAGVFQLDGDFKGDLFRGALHPKDLLEQVNPKPLGLLFFVALIFPVKGELLCGSPLLGFSHGNTPHKMVFFFSIA